ncbi:MAG TPA: carboxymuconolactone decarboxylase family protein [Gemmatimonadaceae bacterium]
MPADASPPGTLDVFDEATRRLVRTAAVITAGGEDDVRSALAGAAGVVPDLWIEELLLQTYLFAGFPRALNATREWRRHRPAPASGGATSTATPANVDAWRAAGEETCAAVYGTMYERLRRNILALHPALDEWMVVEGYGKVLSRPGLDLPRRELCIVAACAAANQDRQLHSHLHGAVNVGVQPAVLDAAIDALSGLLSAERLNTVRLLWARVRGK